MGQPTNDPRVTYARNIIGEAHRLHVAGATRPDLVYYFERVNAAGRLLLEVLDDVVNTSREPRTPDIEGSGHSFVQCGADRYVCERCGRETDQATVYYISVFETCGGEHQ